ERARLEWQQAVGADPDGFYGLRASDLLTGRRFSGAAPAGAFDPKRYASRGDAGEAEAWLAGWAGERPEGEPGGEWPSILAGREGWQRGLAQWALGDVEAPLALLREAQAAINDQPWALYALARHARDQRLYLVATVAAARVLALAPPDARAQAPRLLRELAYPTYYAELVLPEAQADGLDPLLFYALTRQESLFDAGATSYAGARGLAQVMPATGAYIAGKLGDSAYTPERLYWPAVSIRYGVWYLASALRMFDGNALKALVAYNAGPGNAAKWAKLAGDDDDLFFEVVAARQPRAYMERIYEHRNQYERLYR
ncbi:MAG: lytic transglycosylase domain-containing protein, partial [Anaerolineae bacterium]